MLKDIKYVTRYWCQKTLPLVYDDSLSYYEILCKVVDYLNKLIENTSQMGDDIVDIDDKLKDLQTAYEQLKSYVDNWFNNPEETWLPQVKEEIETIINKWFDEHPDIATKVDFNTTDRVCNTVDDMVNNTDIKLNDKIRTNGYYNVGDGGGAYYVVTNITPATHYESLSNGLYARLVQTNEMNVKMYGARPNENFDSTQAIQHCVKENSVVYITDGLYIISQPIELHSNLAIYGCNSGELTAHTEIGPVLYTHDNYDTDNVIIDGLTFTGNVALQEDSVYPLRTRAYKNENYGHGISHAIAVYGSRYKRETKTKILKDLTITNCTFRDIETLPILICGCEGKLTVDNNKFFNNMDIGIIDCENVFITNNLIKYSYDMVSLFRLVMSMLCVVITLLTLVVIVVYLLQDGQ